MEDWTFKKFIQGGHPNFVWSRSFCTNLGAELVLEILEVQRYFSRPEGYEVTLVFVSPTGRHRVQLILTPDAAQVQRIVEMVEEMERPWEIPP